MSRVGVRKILEKLNKKGECHNMDMFINSSILLSAYGKKQYFEVDKDIKEEGLVLYLISNGCPVATIMEKNIESITVLVTDGERK